MEPQPKPSHSWEILMSTSRRRFLRAAVPAAAFTILPRHVLGGRGVVAPSDKVNIAIVGAGGQGRSNTRRLIEAGRCPDHRRGRPGGALGPRDVLFSGPRRSRTGTRRDRKALCGADPELPLRRVRGLSRDAGKGEGDRRNPMRHSGSFACLCHAHGDAAGHTCTARNR